MNLTIRNGVRVAVDFPSRNRPGFSGWAAIEETETGGRVYFACRPVDVKGVSAGVVDGRAVEVDAISASERTSAIVVVAFRWT